jgi:NAD(P)-dependent dehydrogenase (short-subunit alcohol dehydrogenase family)
MTPIISYENKTAAVTGAAAGLGPALVEHLRAADACRARRQRFHRRNPHRPSRLLGNAYR